MSKHPKTEAKYKTAEQIKQAFNDACFQRGQEHRNEERAIANQNKLADLQADLEEMFNARMALEQEQKAQQAKAAEQAQAFEAKVATSTPEAPVENSSKS